MEAYTKVVSFLYLVNGTIIKLYKYGPHSLKTTLEMLAVPPIDVLLEWMISRLWMSVVVTWMAFSNNFYFVTDILRYCKKLLYLGLEIVN